jgi:hypothetical protein
MAGCVIKCAILFNDAHGQRLTTRSKFETLSLLGSIWRLTTSTRSRKWTASATPGSTRSRPATPLGVAMETASSMGRLEERVALLGDTNG